MVEGRLLAPTFESVYHELNGRLALQLHGCAVVQFENKSQQVLYLRTQLIEQRNYL